MTDSELHAVLVSHDLNPKRVGGQWSCRCAAHEEKNPSMTAKVTPDGTVLVHCFVGCTGKMILAALGLLGAGSAAFGSDRPAKRRYEPVIPKSDPSVVDTWIKMQIANPPNEPEAHEDALGIPPGGLNRLGVVWSERLSALACPMWDRPAGNVIGIRLRFEDGQKKAVTGSHNGLFCSLGNDDGPIYMPEGMTDTAALAGLGLNAIGRPSATGGRDLIAAFANGTPIIVVADADAPGQEGAFALSIMLKSKGCKVKLLSPPAGIKDAREWIKRGATRSTIEWAANNRGEE
mgnify:CR=1 FL=1